MNANDIFFSVVVVVVARFIHCVSIEFVVFFVLSDTPKWAAAAAAEKEDEKRPSNCARQILRSLNATN